MRLPLFVALSFGLSLSAGACATSSETHPRSTSATGANVVATPAEQARMQAHLDQMVDARYVRATYALDDQERDILCVDRDRQPGCDAPRARGEVCPASPPPSLPSSTSGGQPALRSPVATGPTCPEGTVPIVRPRLSVLQRFPTLEDYLRGNKGPGPSRK